MSKAAVPIGIFAIAMALRLQLAAGTYAIHVDGAVYIHQYAPALREEGLTSVGPSKFLFPALLLAAGDDARRMEIWGLVLSVVGGAFAACAVYGIASSVYPRPIPALAGLFAAVHPIWVETHSEVLTEGITHPFLFAAVALLLAWIRKPTLWSVPVALACAAIAAAGRKEGWLVAGFIVPAALVATLADRARFTIRMRAMVLLAFVAIAAAGIAFLLGLRPSHLKDMAGRYIGGAEPIDPGASAEYRNKYGVLAGNLLYYGRRFAVGLPPWLLLPLAAAALVSSPMRRRSQLLLLAGAAFALLAGFGLARIQTRADERYFSLAYALFLPAAAHGILILARALARLVPGIEPRLWIIAATLGLLFARPHTIAPRRWDEWGHRKACESLRALAPATLHAAGPNGERIIHYAFPTHIIPLEPDAEPQEVDALLLRSDQSPPWMRRLLDDTLRYWGSGWIERRFPDPPRRGVHEYVLYLRPGLAPPP